MDKPKTFNNMCNAMKNAETNAKKRKFKICKKHEAVNLTVVDAEEEKANKGHHTIVKIRDRNKAEFTQLVNANFAYLLKNKYLTTAEESMIIRLMPFLELESNALTKIKFENGDIKFIRGQFPSITEIATFLDRDLSTISKTINQLIKKGILYEIIDSQTLKIFRRPVKARQLFFNPEIVFAGDKNKINLTLCRIHWENDRLERNKLKLPWKIWYSPGCLNGRLYRRTTWLDKKRK